MRPLLINGVRCCGACGNALEGAGRCRSCGVGGYGEPRRLYRRGDRVRLLVMTAGSWIGEGVVSHDQPLHDVTVHFVRDDPDDGTDRAGFAHWSELELIESVAVATGGA
jgi:hypothetical protein